MAEKGEKFYSFERALRELNLREEELKRLVSEGEIRAFRDEDKMKFRKEDIERLRTGRASAVDKDLVDVTGEGQEAGGETVADAEDLIFDEEEDLELEEEPGMATAPISSPPEEDVEEVAQGPAVPARPRPSAARPRKTTSRAARVREPEAVGGYTSPLLMILILASTLCLLYGVFVTLSTASTRTNSMTKSFADMMYSMGFATKS